MSDKVEIIETVEVDGVFVPTDRKEQKQSEPKKVNIQYNNRPINTQKSQVNEFLSGFQFGVSIINTVTKLLK